MSTTTQNVFDACVYWTSSPAAESCLMLVFSQREFSCVSFRFPPPLWTLWGSRESESRCSRRRRPSPSTTSWLAREPEWEESSTPPAEDLGWLHQPKEGVKSLKKVERLSEAAACFHETTKTSQWYISSFYYWSFGFFPGKKIHSMNCSLFSRPLEVSVDLILIALTVAAFEPAFTRFNWLLFALHDVTPVLLTQTECLSWPSVLWTSVGLQNLSVDSV